MIAKKMGTISILTNQLAQFEKKYFEITKELEEERELSMISDEPGNYYQILQERVFLLKKMDIIRAKIKRANYEGKKASGENLVDRGKRVKLENHSQCLLVTIVPEYDADPSQGYISENSPIGKALFGKSIGDNILVKLPNGNIEYIVRGIS